VTFILVNAGASYDSSERKVGVIELSIEDPRYHCQREPAGLELLDLRETLDVLRSVPPDPTFSLRRLEQTPLLVEANRVDRQT
jgi:hypothetical protein